MSRTGKLPIKIPENVTINFTDSDLTVKGKFGILNITIPAEILTVNQNNNVLNIELKNAIKKNRSFHGLYRTLIYNMVKGVSEQFEITLKLVGVGYRATVQGKDLILNLGYSHPVNITIPQEINVEVIQNTTINLKSCNKESLGQFAANIRTWRPPEPYKGKGILYKDEQILRKAGKSGK
jgi:large subunit ribosomal protein L6